MILEREWRRTWLIEAPVDDWKWELAAAGEFHSAILPGAEENLSKLKKITASMEEG